MPFTFALYIEFTLGEMAENVKTVFVCCSEKKIPVTLNEVRATSLAKIRFLPPIKLSLNLFRSLMHRSMHCVLLIYMIKHFQCTVEHGKSICMDFTHQIHVNLWRLHMCARALPYQWHVHMYMCTIVAVVMVLVLMLHQYCIVLYVN